MKKPQVGDKCRRYEGLTVYTVKKIKKEKGRPKFYQLESDYWGDQWLTAEQFYILPEETNQKNMKKPHPYIGRKCVALNINTGKPLDGDIFVINGIITRFTEEGDRYLVYQVSNPERGNLSFHENEVMIIPEVGLSPSDSRLKDFRAFLDYRKSLTMDDVTLAENVHVKPVKPCTWITVRIDYEEVLHLREKENMISDIRYHLDRNTISFNAIGNDGKFTNEVVSLPDCAEVTIGRTFDNLT